MPNVSNKIFPIRSCRPFSTVKRSAFLVRQLLLSTGAINVPSIFTGSFEKLFVFRLFSNTHFAFLQLFMIVFANSVVAIEHLLPEASRRVTWFFSIVIFKFYCAILSK